MANETPITIIGNLTKEPELRYTQTGVAVAKITIASTPQKYDSRTNQWVDDNPIYMECTAWRTMAENIAQTLAKGMRVIVSGVLRCETWQDKNTGDNRSKTVVEIHDVAPSLRFATAQVHRNPPAGQQGGQQPAGQRYNNQQGGQQYNSQQQAGNSSWQASSNQATGGAYSNQQAANMNPWGGGTDEPPF